jgi:hypothetical protein
MKTHPYDVDITDGIEKELKNLIMPMLNEGIMKLVTAHLSQTRINVDISGEKIHFELNSDSWDVTKELGEEFGEIVSPLEDWLMGQFEKMSEYGDDDAASNQAIQAIERVIAKVKAHNEEQALIDGPTMREAAIAAMAEVFKDD